MTSVMRVALSEVLGALSYALDVTEGEPPGHAVRTTVIGMRLGEQVGLDEDAQSALFYALLLKDAGCSSNAARLSSLFAADDQRAKHEMKRIDWSSSGALVRYAVRNVTPGAGPLAKARGLRRLVQEQEVTREMIGTRCERGAEIARMLELPPATQEAIRALDEHWDGAGQPFGLRGEEIPLLGRILCLAQTVEVFVRTLGIDGALAMALKRRGRWFDPALVDALLAIRDDRRLWGPLEDPRTVPSLALWEPADRVRTAGDEDLDRIAQAFARVIDAKSPYTADHSAGVAHWAVAAGTVLGLAGEALRDLRRAGLLHDIGTLAVSSRILDKPGRLEPEEMAVMREHPRYTEKILERVACFRGIVETAAGHHERLDGTGYHRSLAAFDLSRSARILAVAGVYEALTADRPYRVAMPREKALAILHEQRGTGLCPTAVDALGAAVHDAAPWTAGLAGPADAPRSAVARSRAG
ncbi:MAG TPA: HD domain-containing phosphohydrolase [Solirubrobacteraceae bacterium]|jgi:HD-GYP domain-containing protein (c-di-GMP phosphodiesterase class II)|nr:HD domain-containing phosphohydrolase [Solirubrobacteraceae bacterium]